MRKNLQQASFLVAGALLSVAVTIAVDWPCRYTLVVTLFFCTIFFCLLGFGTFHIIGRSFRHWGRSGRRLPYSPIRIGVLYDMGWGEKERYESISAATDISPMRWRTEILRQAFNAGLGVRVDMIDSTVSFEPFSVILNPYGGVYPEYDLEQLISLRKIVEYTKNGGIFFNTADIPGFWLYNPRLERRLPAASAVHSLTLKDKELIAYTYRPYEKIPFLQKLALEIDNCDETFSLTSGETKTVNSLNVVRTSRIEGNMLPIWWDIEKKTTPFFGIPYGKGFFLISLLWLNQTNGESEEIMKLLVKQLVSTICSHKADKKYSITEAVLLMSINGKHGNSEPSLN